MIPCKSRHPHPNCPWRGRDRNGYSHNYNVECPGDRAFLKSPAAIPWLISYIVDGHNAPPDVKHAATQHIINRLWPLAILAHAAGVQAEVP